MLKRLLIAAAVALTMALPALAPLASAQTAPFFQIPFLRIPGANQSKFPEVAGFGATVSISGNSERTKAYLWEKADIAPNIAGPFELGTAAGQSDFATTSLTYGADGTLYYVWSDFAVRRINIRVRRPGEGFGPIQLVTGASPFPSEPDVAVSDTPNGRFIFVFWREDRGELRYRFSQTNGASWSGTGTVNTGTFPEISAYGNPNGQIAVGYTRPGGSGTLQAYVSFWDGASSFRAPERISPGGTGGFAEPTIARQPDGSFAAIYRGIDRDANWGTYIATRNSDGTWNNAAPFGRIDRGDISSTWIEVDPQGNWHLFWAGIPARTGRQNVYYSRRNAGQTNLTQALASGGEGAVYNVAGALTVRDNAYAHAVYERFEGDFSKLGYSMVASPGATPAADGVVIDQSAPFTNKLNARVDFTNPRNSPTQVRYRWGAPPTPSDPAVAFSNPLNLPLPAIATPNVCTNLTLYTQLLNAAGGQSAVLSDTIVVDRAVQASVSIAAAQPGYDPTFTRSTAAAVIVRAVGECAGLDQATVSGGTSAVTIPINGQTQASGIVALTTGDARKTFEVVVVDRAGNSSTEQVQLTLDTTAPALNAPGIATIAPGAPFSGIVTAQLNGLRVTEPYLYGVQVTTRYTPVGGAAITGTPQVVPAALVGERLAFDFSVAGGLPAGTPRTGSYELSIRFVDKAGNVSAIATSGTISFNQSPTFPRLYLPIVRK